MDRRLTAFAHLLDIMDELREKCPWDKKQTMLSLRNLTIEEVYELADAILDEDVKGVKEELGDIMLHLVFYAKIASEKHQFDIADALEAVNQKLINRHPHIYGDVKAEDEEAVKRNWEQIKMQEKGKQSVLQGVPRSLPAMVKAYRMQDKTKQVGFEWTSTTDVWSKVKEELEEYEEAQASHDLAHQEEEFGDLLFSLINYARYVGIDPETALEKTNQKFKRRFEHVEAFSSKPLLEMSLSEMDQLWDDAKKLGK